MPELVEGSGISLVRDAITDKLKISTPTASVKADYGAKGDGTTNDTAAFVAMAASGRDIILPSGTYLIDPVALSGLTSFRIRGAGRDSTKILLRTTGTALAFSNCQWVQISDLTVQAIGTAQTLANARGIEFNGASSNSIVERCNFVGFTLGGMRQLGTVGSPLTGHIVRDCYFLGNGGNQLELNYSHDFTVVDNQFGKLTGIAHAATGCLLSHSAEGDYKGNKHWNNVIGLQTIAGTANRIIGNRFEESDHEGVWLEGDEWIFEGNVVHTNSQTTSGSYDNVYIRNGGNQIFVGNKIRSWDATFSRWGVNIDTSVDNITIGKNQVNGYGSGFGPYRVASTVSRLGADRVVSGVSTAVAAGATVYMLSGGQTSEAAAYIPLGGRTAVLGFAVTTEAAPGASQSFTYTLRKNTADTAMVATSSGASSFSARASSTTPQIVGDVGDTLSIKLVTSGTATVTNHRFYLLLAEY
jgi:hypothetical protein